LGQINSINYITATKITENSQLRSQVTALEADKKKLEGMIKDNQEEINRLKEMMGLSETAMMTQGSLFGNQPI